MRFRGVAQFGLECLLGVQEVACSSQVTPIAKMPGIPISGIFLFNIQLIIQAISHTALNVRRSPPELILKTEPAHRKRPPCAIIIHNIGTILHTVRHLKIDTKDVRAAFLKPERTQRNFIRHGISVHRKLGFSGLLPGKIRSKLLYVRPAGRGIHIFANTAGYKLVRLPASLPGLTGRTP